MTKVEWDLIKGRLSELAGGQQEVAKALKELHDCIDDSKNQIKNLTDSVDDIHKMILSMVPNGDLFQHKFDHIEIADHRGLKKVGQAKAVEVMVAGGLAILALALIFYFKFGMRNLPEVPKDLGALSPVVIATRPETAEDTAKN